MATLKFAAPAVLELLRHALAAPKHVSPYGEADPGPGLFLVKDEGIYLMSNGKPGLPGGNAPNKVVYAKVYEPLTEKRRDGGDNRPTLRDSLVSGDPDLARGSEVFYYSSAGFLTVWRGQPSSQ